MTTLPRNQCLSCGHVWTPRRDGRAVACPKCFDRRWDEEKEQVSDNKNRKGA